MAKMKDSQCLVQGKVRYLGVTYTVMGVALV